MVMLTPGRRGVQSGAGNTPMMFVSRLLNESHKARVACKLELMEPCSSVKDRHVACPWILLRQAHICSAQMPQPAGLDTA